MSTATTSPSPRGPSRKVGIWATLRAGGGEVARDSGVRAAGGALDVAELGRHLHRCAELARPERSGPAAVRQRSAVPPSMFTTAPVTV